MTELWKRIGEKNVKRKAGRRWLAAAMAALLAAGTLAGCGGSGTDGSQAGSSQSGESGSPAGQGSSQGGAAGNEVTAKGRFVESEIALPEEVEGMHLLTALQREDGSITVYFHKDRTDYCGYIYDGGKWTEAESVPELPDGIKMNDLFEGADGKLYAGGHGEGYVYHLFEIGDSGRATEVFADAFAVPEGKEYGAIPDYLNVLANGNLLLSQVSGVEVYNPDGNKLFSMSQEFIGTDIRFPACAGEDFYLTLDDGGGRLVCYDTDTGVERGSFETPEKTAENKMRMLLFEDGEGGFYAAGPSGLYHTGKDGTIWEQLIDGSLNSMSRQDLTARRFFAGKDGSYYGVFTVVDEGKVLFLRYAFDSTVDTVPPNVVSVYSLRDNRLVRQAAAILQKNNPQIRVDFKVAVEDEEEAVTEDVIRALNTELLNGKGADVLILDGLPAESYREKGILADMTELTESLKPDLLPSVVKAFGTEDGKVYYLPARVMLPVVYGKPEAVEAYQSLDKMKSYEGTPTLFTPDIYENMLRQTAYTCYGEIFAEDGSLTDGALEKMLEAVKSAGERSNAKIQYTESEMKQYNVNNYVMPDGFGRQDAFSLAFGACAASVQLLGGIDNAMLPFSAAEKGGYGLQDINGIYVPGTLVGINASSPNQDGAEEFLMTLFGDEVQEQSLWNGFPVRSESLEKWKAMEKETVVIVSHSSDERSLEGAWPTLSQRAELIEMVKNAGTPAVVDPSVMQMIVDGSKDYLDGKGTLEGAVSDIENKIRIYMAERE